MQTPAEVIQSRLPVRLNWSAWIWVGLWGAVSVLAWSLAFTFRPTVPYKYSIKILHVLVFLPWSIATIRGWREFSGRPANVPGELAALVVMAGLVELAERWIPEHEPDWVGFSCSCAGAALAALLVWRSDRRNGSKLRNPRIEYRVGSSAGHSE